MVKIFLVLLIVLLPTTSYAQDEPTESSPLTTTNGAGNAQIWTFVVEKDTVILYMQEGQPTELVLWHTESWSIPLENLGEYRGIREKSFVFEKFAIVPTPLGPEFIAQQTVFLDDQCWIYWSTKGLAIEDLEEGGCDGLNFQVTRDR